MAKKEKEPLKRIDIHKDYLLWNLANNTKNSVMTLCIYMQNVTPYGDKYMAAYNQYKKLMRELGKFEDLLAKCVEITPKKDEE